VDRSYLAPYGKDQNEKNLERIAYSVVHVGSKCGKAPDNPITVVGIQGEVLSTHGIGQFLRAMAYTHNVRGPREY
jgi:hypothetical protein